MSDLCVIHFGLALAYLALVAIDLRLPSGIRQ